MKAIDIRKRRKELDLSQEELGNIIGVAKNTIYNYEKGGAIPDSSYKMLQKILFDIDVETIDKTDKVNSLKAEIYQATSNLIDILNKQIAEAQKDTSSLKSIEELQQLLKLKLELVDQLRDSMK